MRNRSFFYAMLVYATLACLTSEVRAQATLLTGLGGPVGFGNDTGLVNDDGSTATVDIRPAFSGGLCFFGRTYNSVFINTNGNITFNAALGTFTPSAFPIASQPMIAPFWADVDTRGTGTGIPPENRVYLSQSANRFVVTWHRVGYYAVHIDRRNSFQLIISQYRDAMNYDIEFRYNALQWTTGDASGGTGGLGGTPAQAGFDAGDRINFAELAGSRTAAALMWISQSNLSPPIDGVFRFQVRACTVPRCGNRTVEAGEECDDGNRVAGDGCSPNCTREIPNGERCVDSDQCRSRFCVDGVCCESACSGRCEACNQTGSAGRCVAVRGTPVLPRVACPGTAGSACASSCDGTRRDACTTPADGTACTSSECRAGRCMAGTCSMLASSCPMTAPLCDATGMCVQCLSNRDCPDMTPVCDATTRRCVACRADSDCSSRPGTPVCATSGTNAGRCVQCTAMNTMACTGATSVCDAMTNTCVGCASNSDCPVSAPVCNPMTRRCGACTADSECAPRMGTTVCATTGTNMGQCVQCTTTSAVACTGETPVCEDRSNTCVGCVSNRDCPASAPVCNAMTRRCGACTADADCEGRMGTMACATMGTNMGRCVQCTAMNGSACMGSTPACDDRINRCVRCTNTTAMMTCAMDPSGTTCVTPEGDDPFCGCTRDAECGDVTSGRICDPMTRRCRPGCWPGDGHNNCPMGQFCTSNDSMRPGMCTTSCNFDMDCTRVSPMRPYCLRTVGDAGVPDDAPDGGKGEVRNARCVECRDDMHCASRSDGRTRCIGVDNSCAQCTTEMRDRCSAQAEGSACLMTGLCGCTTDADCAADRQCNNATNRCEARPDAGTPAPDVSTPPVDSGTVDATPMPDDLGLMDAGTTQNDTTYRGGGCGCRTPGSSGATHHAPAALVLGLACVALARRRRVH